MKRYIDKKVEKKLGILIRCVKRVALLSLSQRFGSSHLASLVTCLLYAKREHKNDGCSSAWLRGDLRIVMATDHLEYLGSKAGQYRQIHYSVLVNFGTEYT